MSASGGSDTGEQLGEAAAEKVYYASNRSILFLCICLGCSYQCVTEFPYLILSHGGACFLLPYAAVLILLGIPMAAFEMTIGQFRGRGCLELWACVPVGKGIGMAMLLKTFVVTAYKAFYDSCSFYYFLQAFQEDLPWTKCFTWWGASPLNCRERDVDRARACHAEKVRLHQDSVQQAYPPGPNDTWLTVCGQSVRVPFNVYSAALPAECRDPRLHSEYAFFLHGVLKMTRGIDDFGGIRWELLVCYIFTWFVIFVCTAHGVATVGKISPLLGLLPIVVFVAVTAVMLFLPNARSSVFELMYPHWEALYDAGAWSDASYFVLSGLAVGQGQLQALASYSSFDSYTLQWAFLALPLVMTLFNLLSCVLVFGVTGHLAGHLKTCVAEFDTHTYAFPFVIFPEVVKTMSWPKFLSGLFFSSLFALSVDTLVSGKKASFRSGQCAL
ncbi:sodium-dependent nutrient amino acid transporter 1-like [Haemaphysalis longicornis]